MASVASTYARAFADVVLGAHLDANRGITELRAIASLLNESSELRRVWENPAIPADQKRRVLDAIVARDGISKQVRNLLAVLIDHRRVHFLGPVIRQLEKELDARLGFAEANDSLDVDGHDTAHKAAVLAALAYGFWVPQGKLYTEGLRAVEKQDIVYARKLGYALKLLAIIRSTEV